MKLRQALRQRLEEVFPGVRPVVMAGDASTRRFYRLQPGHGPSWVVMDYGHEFVDETDDVRLTRIFQQAGLPVPEIAHVWPDLGCLVLEDLGKWTLQRALESASEAKGRALFERAVVLAAQIAQRGTPALADSGRGLALDAPRFRYEMEFFAEHYLGGHCAIPQVPSGLMDELDALADRAADTPRSVLCHRDYHSRNILVRDGGALVLVDIQDARWGPDTYDLASLLFDAYIDIPKSGRGIVSTPGQDIVPSPGEGVVPTGGQDIAGARGADTGETLDWVRVFLSHGDGVDDEAAFRSRLETVASQRLLKALGTFGYQITQRGKTEFRDAIPRTQHRLHGLLPNIEGGRHIMTALHDLGAL